MTRKRVLECREQVPTLFAQGRKITANATKDGDSVDSASLNLILLITRVNNILYQTLHGIGVSSTEIYYSFISK